MSATIMALWAWLVSNVGIPLLALMAYLTNRDVKKVKTQTDGMASSIATMAEQKGHKEGVEHATAAAEEKAATLAEGQAKGIEIARAGAQMKEEDKP